MEHVSFLLPGYISRKESESYRIRVLYTWAYVADYTVGLCGTKPSSLTN
jgi:hypothetical protein